jgi:flagellar biosynthetic protein FlhB
LTPKASKIDPIKGFGKIISKRSLAELGKAIFKIIIVGWAAFSTLKNDIYLLLPLMYQEKTHIISMLGDISFRVIIRCSCVIFFLAILDYIYQKWEFEQNLKMTKQEVKDEFKQTEGDPLVKSRIRSIQREMARRRMMEEVPKADVVITNPTHLSVALRYSHEENMTAPRIVAKGANNVAFKIREVAKKHDIPLIENKSLAQNLYKLDIGEEIPPQFYQAVAEILAYVYGLKKKKAYTG